VAGQAARSAAAAALDEDALATLRRQRCVVRPDFLNAQEASALHEEFRSLADEDGQRGGQSIFTRSRTALVNHATHREFFNLSADDARRMGAPVIARTLDALAALAERLGAASAGAITAEVGPDDAPAAAWWSSSVLVRNSQLDVMARTRVRQLTE
jgi:hypothetical protein